MHPLKHALQDHELMILRVIGEWWELDLTGKNKTAALTEVAQRMNELDMVQELQFLPPDEAAGVMALVKNGGRVAVGTFSRKFGEVRHMGPARLEREEPWFDPANTAESLWYRGFLFKGFDETDEGLLEFFYLPDELQAKLVHLVEEVVMEEAGQTTAVSSHTTNTLLSITPPPNIIDAPTQAIDDLTTMLGLAQLSVLNNSYWQQLNTYLLDKQPDRRSLLLTLGAELDILKRAEGRVKPTRTAVQWLRQTRAMQQRSLAQKWQQSRWNDLCHTPLLTCSGDSWQNDPTLARNTLIKNLPRTSDWFRLTDLVSHIKATDPDFQRPDGNYDTWYILDEETSAYVTGFESWDVVEGRLLAFLIEGPLHWLGMVDLSQDESGILFRLTASALAWLNEEETTATEINVPLVVQKDGTLIVPFNAERFQRFQVSRISEPLPVEAGQPYQYRLTPQSLKWAQEQGIQPDRVLTFLEKASGRPIPTAPRRAITRWHENGVEGRLETAVILRVKTPDILDTLRQNPKTRDFIGEALGDLSAIIRADQWEEFRTACTQLGLFLDAEV